MTVCSSPSKYASKQLGSKKGASTGSDSDAKGSKLIRKR